MTPSNLSPFLLSALLAGSALWSLAASSDPSALPFAATKHWTADNGNGTYSNPLFYEEFEDPDIIRVGDDYYLTGTTMHMNPGLILLHSKDLVNWELASYCMDRLDLGPASAPVRPFPVHSINSCPSTFPRFRTTRMMANRCVTKSFPRKVTSFIPSVATGRTMAAPPDPPEATPTALTT